VFRRFRVFVPILAGATLRERMIASFGALVGIGLTALLCGRLLEAGSLLPMIVAPMGASAVLLFAVPASPMAQPWSIVGGNTISALVGVAVAQWIDDPALAAGLGVSLAIVAMSFTRCLHPPGGAAALTAVLGGPAVVQSGMLFPFVPVALNSLALVTLGLVFHRLAGRGYPHHPPTPGVNTHQTLDRPAQLRAGFLAEDIDAALRDLNETFDVDREDVARLLQQVELQAAVRTSGDLKCADIMSRDIIAVGPGDDVDTARSLLLIHQVRVLPVIASTGELLGIVGLRELALADGNVGGCMSKAATAAADDSAVSLVPALIDGTSHAVVIVDAQRGLVGLITQTDLLVAMMRTLARRGDVSSG
jgi:CBS domain-containing membrane protein